MGSPPLVVSLPATLVGLGVTCRWLDPARLPATDADTVTDTGAVTVTDTVTGTGITLGARAPLPQAGRKARVPTFSVTDTDTVADTVTVTDMGTVTGTGAETVLASDTVADAAGRRP